MALNSGIFCHFFGSKEQGVEGSEAGTPSQQPRWRGSLFPRIRRRGSAVLHLGSIVRLRFSGSDKTTRCLIYFAPIYFAFRAPY